MLDKLKMYNKITKKYQFYLSFILEFFFKKEDFMTRKHLIKVKKGKEERKRRKKKKKMIERKLFRIAIAILHMSHILSSIICRLAIYIKTISYS